MHLYLVRHAIAAQPDAKHWPDDRQRPLTTAGARRFKRAADPLVALIKTGGKVGRLLTSPLVRARATRAPAAIKRALPRGDRGVGPGTGSHGGARIGGAARA